MHGEIRQEIGFVLAPPRRWWLICQPQPAMAAAAAGKPPLLLCRGGGGLCKWCSCHGGGWCSGAGCRRAAAVEVMTGGSRVVLWWTAGCLSRWLCGGADGGEAALGGWLWRQQVSEVVVRQQLAGNGSRPAVASGGRERTSKDDQLKQLMPLLEEGGLAPKLSNLHQFKTIKDGSLTLEEARLQMDEIKRLAYLKAEKENEWIELNALAFRNQNKSNDQLLKDLKANFHLVVTRDGKLRIPPPPQLTAFKALPVKKKGT
nr:hypothetical protein [Tanacetum cinerariifolium]